MAAVITRQDLQGVLDTAKNRIIERMLTKRDVQVVTEMVRDRIIAGLQDIYQFDQQAARQTILQLTQQTRRVAGIEMRMAALEGEVKTIKQLMIQILEEQKRVVSVISSMPHHVATATTQAISEEAASMPLRIHYGTT